MEVQGRIGFIAGGSLDTSIWADQGWARFEIGGRNASSAAPDVWRLKEDSAPPQLRSVHCRIGEEGLE